jgi:hypothetical protein
MTFNWSTKPRVEKSKQRRKRIDVMYRHVTLGAKINGKWVEIANLGGQLEIDF